MDMEEMKKGWMVLNERLSQNEILNRRIIKEMLTTRTQTAYEQIYNWEWRNFLSSCLCCNHCFRSKVFK